MTRQTARIAAACGVHMFIIGVFGGAHHRTFAQAQPGVRVGSTQAPAAMSSAAPIVEGTDARPVELLVGRSTLVDIGSPIARVSLTSADVADALVTGQTQLLVHGKTPGSISMFVWDRAGAVKRYEIAVQRDLARLNDQVKELFPNERIQAQSNGKSVVLSGSISSKEVGEKAMAVAAGYVDKPTDVVNLFQVQAGPRSNQVLLRVRFAEVSRSAMSEFGMSFFTSPTGINNNIGRVTTQQYPAPGYTDLAWTKADSSFGSDVVSAEGKLAFSDFLNVFLLNQKYDLGVLIKALQNRGLFQSLAEPNLVAESGKEASFLAGGEFPVPVAQGSGANIGVSVMFKEFGIRLNFTPTVTGDRVHLKVRPEVSTLDYGNAVLLSGFRIPSLSTRRAETELELSNGQTFAIAGLMSNQMQTTMQKVPGIGDIPVLGYLFRSKASKRDQTELVVMITPEILPNNSPGVTPSLPRYPDTFLPPVSDLKGTHPAPAPAFTQPSRSQAMAPATAPTVVDNRTEIERAQDRALEALDRQQNQRPVAAAAAPNANDKAVAVTPVAATAPQVAQPSQVTAQPATVQAADSSKTVAQADAEAIDLTKEQRDLMKAAREQAERDAKAAEKARKEEAKRAAMTQAEQDKAAREQAKRDAEAARVQAKRDAEAAKEQAKRDAEAAKVQAKRDAEMAKLQAKQEAVVAREQQKLEAQAAREQAEVQKQPAKGDRQADVVAQRQAVEANPEAREQDRQRALDAAAERLRAAEEEYQAELARRSQR
jgi:pilus assembly protein CpaC